MDATRRDVLKIGGLGALGTVGATVLPWGSALDAKAPSRLPADLMPRPFRTRFVRPDVLRPRKSVRGSDGVWTDHFLINERVGRAEIIPGLRTTVFGYNGQVPGPTLNIRQGRRAVVRVCNHLPARHPVLGQDSTTSVHLHGSASLPQYDGYASDITPPDSLKDYRYPNFQPARTLWYHDHGVHHTA
ncbi:MAG: multicopper oxidase domain-containing protein, partial [Actinomycetota bacterium]|nr:multicopper oxidase domain-containing protein [Actinomycetota bacterium]